MTATATPPPELHLPDLPEVPVTLGPAAEPRAVRDHEPWAQRVRRWLSAYLPLLLMALLALSTWWLVKHTPGPTAPAGEPVVRTEPDYTMHGFGISRFGPDGRVALRIDGRVLRHYPDTDRFEIDDARIVALSPQGRRTSATARRALSNADGTEVQMLGGAQVVSQQGAEPPLQIEGEFLHADLRFERLKSHLPVTLVRGNDRMRAGGIDYDHLERRIVMHGPVRSVIGAGGRAPLAASAPMTAHARSPDPRP